jgi:hypothetical protein
MRELDLAATAELDSGAGSRSLRGGVRLLDAWRDGSYGAVLFWVDRALGLWDVDHAVLHHVDCELHGGAWRSRGSGAAGTHGTSEILAQTGPGLHRLGGGSQDPVRVTCAIASPEVSTIELRSAHRVTERRPGVDGFCILGIKHQDPITHAYAVNSTGDTLPGEPLLL